MFESTAWGLYAPSHINVCITIFWRISLLPGAYGLKALNYSWLLWMTYVFPSPLVFLVLLSKFLAEDVTGQCSLLIFVALCWMNATWLLHCFQHVGRHSSYVFHGKNFHQQHFSRLSDKGSAITAFNPLATQLQI